jgi:hypothetical protein
MIRPQAGTEIRDRIGDVALAHFADGDEADVQVARFRQLESATSTWTSTATICGRGTLCPYSRRRPM